jgi:hypothetical protein
MAAGAFILWALSGPLRRENQMSRGGFMKSMCSAFGVVVGAVAIIGGVAVAGLSGTAAAAPVPVAGPATASPIAQGARTPWDDPGPCSSCSRYTEQLDQQLREQYLEQQLQQQKG